MRLFDKVLGPLPRYFRWLKAGENRSLVRDVLRALFRHPRSGRVTARTRYWRVPQSIMSDHDLDLPMAEFFLQVAQGRWNLATESALRLQTDRGDRRGLDILRLCVPPGMANRAISTPGKPDSYLVIRATGIGFWGEVSHVLSQVVLAEWIGRIPVVHWGPECLYTPGPGTNAFEAFFEPIGTEFAPRVVAGGSFFPDDYWSVQTVFGDVTRAQSLQGVRPWTGLEVLDRDESVVVADTSFELSTILAWLPPESPWFGLSVEEAYRRLYRRLLHLRPRLQQAVDAYWQERLAGKRVTAVHVRGGDRTESEAKLRENNHRYYSVIDELAGPEGHVFLCTDSTLVLGEFRRRYGARLSYYESQRSSGAEGIHYQLGTDKVSAGAETLIEVELASRCTNFVGCRSNVSGAMARLGQYENKQLFLDLPSKYL